MTTNKQNIAPDSRKNNARISKLLKKIKQGVAVVASGIPGARESDIGNVFRANSDFYYLTGIDEPSMIAIFSSVHPLHQYILFRKEPSLRESIWEGSRMSNLQLKEFIGADAVYPWESFTEKLPEYLQNAKKIYYTPGLETSMDQQMWKIQRELMQRSATPQITPYTIESLERLLEDFRIIKDQQELAYMRKAAEISQKAFARTFAETTPGMYEYEVEALLDYVYRKEGGEGSSFPAIVASGANSTILHYNKNNRQITKKDLILVDSGVSYQHYASDVSRTWPVSGKFTKNQLAVYEAVLEAQKQSIKAIRPGVSVPHFHEVAVGILLDFLMQAKVLSGDRAQLLSKKEYAKFYLHGTGHWLGLEVHDVGGYYSGLKPRVFRPGMVVTVEPGLYFRPDEPMAPAKFRGIGVRIEDDILVTRNGNENLTESIPKEIKDLQHAIRGRS